MGLLEDKWDEWKWRFDPNKTTEKESLKTAGGNQDQSSTFKFHKGMFWKKNLQDKNKNKGISFLDMGEGTGSQTGMDTKTGNTILPSNPRYQTINKMQNTQNQNLMKNDFTQGRTSDGIDLSKWHGNNAQDQQSWWQKLAGKAGIDYKTAQATWKEKGGFEGLMANPAFTMGLAFMQAGAEGKTLGQGALDNVMKSAGISSHYKKILEDRKLEPIQATGGDIAEVKDMLKSINIEEGNWLENFLSGPGAGARYEAAVEEIALEFQKEIRAKQKVLLEKGESQVIRRTDQLKILERLVNSKKIKKKGSFLSDWGITAKTLQKPVPMVQGGSIAKGQPAIVGEGGPEYFLPKQSGKILSNDDSRIFAMLLTANPQLQQVSRTRAEKILRNRFPEYFE